MYSPGADVKDICVPRPGPGIGHCRVPDVQAAAFHLQKGRARPGVTALVAGPTVHNTMMAVRHAAAATPAAAAIVPLARSLQAAACHRESTLAGPCTGGHGGPLGDRATSRQRADQSSTSAPHARTNACVTASDGRARPAAAWDSAVCE